MQVLLKRFHLNGHTIGFHPHTQKLESPLMSPELTLGMKGLEENMTLSSGVIVRARNASGKINQDERTT